VHGKLSDAKYLITDDLKSKTSKMISAVKKGIEIYTYKQFIDKFCKNLSQKVTVQKPVVIQKTKGLF